jgi:uncharacterized protein YndB with AHSA1/START domain
MSVDIDAPPDVVWPYLVEAEKTRAWFAGARRGAGMGWTVSAESFEWTSEPGGIGSTFHWFEQGEGSALNLNLETTEWTPPFVFGFRMTDGDVYKSYEERWVIEEIPTGSRFTFNDHVEFPYGLFGKLFGLLAAKTARRTGRHILDDLKRLAEADAEVAAE